MKYAVLGLGGRGCAYSYNFKADGRAQMVAVCDINPGRCELAVREFGVDPKMCFNNINDFFAIGKIADLLVIATQDADHYEHALAALEVGYDLLLEKPISDSYERCREIYEKAKEKNCRVYICHVLRYAPQFKCVKEALDTGKYGEIVTLSLTENVEFHHQCHSYVRGSWADTTKSTPMIIAKCCHDTDMISWWLGHKPCISVSSYGSLTYFKGENAPEGATDYCFECPHKETCPASAITTYRRCPDWLRPCVNDFSLLTPEYAENLLHDKNIPYSRCVYKCNNNAVDHQVLNMLFEGGATAQLTMTAFTQTGYREFHIHCTKGDIFSDGDSVTFRTFGDTFCAGETKTVNIGDLTEGNYAHGGGDALLSKDIIEIYDGNGGNGLTTIETSLQSHAIGFAAEESRLNGGKPVVPDCVY